MIFIDSNVPMYLVGAPHPHKVDARQLLESAVASNERLVSSAEVLQEIMHRYVAIGRRDVIQPAFDALLAVADEIYAVGREDVEQAKKTLDGMPKLSARDALHVAVMKRREVNRIMSFDKAFDLVPGIERIRC
ncbi:MAG TPA: type II toxin-antitoxin system VapC family toxin [Gemmatimonadota bacterium]|nr:type II toxin-antitoxin system VapC family toxin [Gemmatimonadota bacterium]